VRNRYISFAAGLGVATLLATAAAADSGSIYMNPGEIKWGDAPPNLPKGARMAVLSGDPGKEGYWCGRLKIPSGYKIAAHWHSTDEDLTVIQGTFYLGEGDKLDMKNAHAIKTGGFHHLPAKTHHYAWAKGETVVQINAKGPFDLVYINPDDDPSKKAAAPAAAPKK